ncbi:glutathione peroxidase [Longispora urticae]
MSLFDVNVNTLAGGPDALGAHRGRTVLLVNVASQCGLTPQYTGLQALAERYGDQGLVVLGVPCNQFGGQEPGSSEEIAEFCDANYGVTFPLTEKLEVNGAGRHPLYQALVDTSDAEGHAGDIRWNFEKFLVNGDGEVVGRFSPQTTPESPELVSAIEKQL